MDSELIKLKLKLRLQYTCPSNSRLQDKQFDINHYLSGETL